MLRKRKQFLQGGSTVSYFVENLGLKLFGQSACNDMLGCILLRFYWGNMMRVPFVFALALTIPSASLSATFFTSAVNWEAAAGPTAAVVLPDSTGGVSSISAGDLTFSISGSATNMLTGPNDDYWSTVIPGNDLAISGPEDFTISFGTAVNAFSFLMHEPTLGTPPGPTNPDTCNTTCFNSLFNFALYSGATLLGSFNFDAADDAAQFVGFTSATAFDRVVVDDVRGTSDNEFFGQFRVSAPLAPVPLPTSLPLLAGGLFGFGYLAKRRRSKKT